MKTHECIFVGGGCYNGEFAGPTYAISGGYTGPSDEIPPGEYYE